MAKVKIKYPQLVVEFIDVEVSNEELEEMKNMSDLDKAIFTAKHLGEKELENLPVTLEKAF